MEIWLNLTKEQLGLKTLTRFIVKAAIRYEGSSSVVTHQLCTVKHLTVREIYGVSRSYKTEAKLRQNAILWQRNAFMLFLCHV